MTPTLWKEIERLYQASKELQTAEERAEFLSRACRDEETRREVESLLSHGDARSFLEQPGLDLVAKMTTGTDSRTLLGLTMDQYQVLSVIGVGGMGVVYRARDTKLGRDVALKALPESFSLDPERVTRFEREARLLASLNHPNIAAIYDLKEWEGIRCLVLELVEGPTLADRIGKGPIPINEALPIACQIAEALEAAHERGVIHRDLKPANVKLTRDGQIKVLDFGLAKAVSSEPGPSNLSNTPTFSAAGTQTGVIMGTAAYMSPEQAQGRAADQRSDVFAFGCVLYEMLTGRQAFDGDTVPDIVAAVLKQEPDLNRLPADTPPAIRRLLHRCLRKDRKQRLQTAGDARIELEEARTEGKLLEVTPVPHGDRRASILTAVFALAILLLLIPVTRQFREGPSVEAPETRLEIATPPTNDPASFAISPDGLRIVFAASTEGKHRLWLRPLNNVTPQLLAGTDGATFPFWSPDSRSIAFFADGKLKRLDIAGGAPQTLASAGAGRGGTWGPDGTIIFNRFLSASLYRVPATGGDAVPATKLQSNQSSHRFPQFIPGSRQFLFYVTGNTDTQGIYVGSLDSTDTKRITSADTLGAYVPPGWLFFLRQGSLVARHFDPVRQELTGDPVTIADTIAINGNTTDSAAFSVSAAGLIAYRTGSTTGRQLNWFDRSGKILGTLVRDENGLSNPELSPDGHRVAVNRIVQGNTDIWIVDASRMTRFTFDATAEGIPLWSPDGTHITFRTNRKATFDLYERSLDISGTESPLVESPQGKSASDWSRDGRFLLYSSLDPTTGRDIWVLPQDGDRKPFLFLKSKLDEFNAQFSPDGRWVAYESNESSISEIYVRPFPISAGQWQISTSGGTSPRWRSDGKELYYVALDGILMAVPIIVKGTTIEPGNPAALFRPNIAWLYTENRPQYDVASDGRFLINVNSEDSRTSPITVLQNWKPPAQ